MESALLLWAHDRAHPFWDALARTGHVLGSKPFCAALVAGMALWLWLEGRRDRAVLWVALGTSTFLLYAGLKALVQRPRPALWPWPVPESGWSFPSGHAIAGATFYPLLAAEASRRRPSWRAAAWTAAALAALVIGLGRVYLGVHWPTDVLAGWALGGAQLWAGSSLLRRRGGGMVE